MFINLKLFVFRLSIKKFNKVFNLIMKDKVIIPPK